MIEYKRKTLMIAIAMFLQCCNCFSQFTLEINPDIAVKKWNAHWIKYTHSKSMYGVYHFRKQFELPEVPDKFIIHISADNKYCYL